MYLWVECTATVHRATVQNSELVIHPWASWNHCEMFWSCVTYIAWAQKQCTCREYWLPQLSILYCLLFKLSGLLWLFFVFLLSCLWYLPSSSSSGLPQPSHGCPECKVAWCWSLLFVGVLFFLSVNYVSKVLLHPFVVAFVVRLIICSISCRLRKLLSLLFLSMPLTFNTSQLLSLKCFVIL